MARILVVDDETSLRGTIAYGLRREGHDVDVAADGEAAFAAWAAAPSDLVILDLMLRRRDLLREEMRRSEVAVDEELRIGRLTIDPARRRIFQRDVEVSLKPREFDLLLFLARHAGQVRSPDHLVEKVWGYDAPGDVRTVRVHIRSVREKLFG